MRLIEARTCPFFAEAQLEVPGWFSTGFDNRWLAIHRARPHDNPHVSRMDWKLSIYPGRDSSQPALELIRPRAVPIATDPNDANQVIFDLIPDAVVQGQQGKPLKPKPYRFKLSRENYNWLVNVVSPVFASGTGPGFDEAGLVRMPAGARRHVQSFAYLSSDVFATTPGASASAAGATTGLAAAAAGVGVDRRSLPAAGAVPVALAPAAAGMPQQQQLQQQHQQLQQQQMGLISGQVTVAGMPPAAVVAGQGPAGVGNPMTTTSTYASPHSAAAPTGANASATMAAGRQPQGTGSITAAGAQASAGSSNAQAASSTASPSQQQPAYLSSLLQLQRDLDDGKLRFDADPPNEMMCPIMCEIMIDPVVASDGHTYSRSGITQWLAHKRTSPKTNEVMADDRLIPNHLLRGQILDWIERNKVGASGAFKQQQKDVPSIYPAAALLSSSSPMQAASASAPHNNSNTSSTVYSAGVSHQYAPTTNAGSPMASAAAAGSSFSTYASPGAATSAAVGAQAVPVSLSIADPRSSLQQLQFDTSGVGALPSGSPAQLPLQQQPQSRRNTASEWEFVPSDPMAADAQAAAARAGVHAYAVALPPLSSNSTVSSPATVVAISSVVSVPAAGTAISLGGRSNASASSTAAQAQQPRDRMTTTTSFFGATSIGTTSAAPTAAAAGAPSTAAVTAAVAVEDEDPGRPAAAHAGLAGMDLIDFPQAPTTVPLTFAMPRGVVLDPDRGLEAQSAGYNSGSVSERRAEPAM